MFYLHFTDDHLLMLLNNRIMLWTRGHIAPAHFQCIYKNYILSLDCFLYPFLKRSNKLSFVIAEQVIKKCVCIVCVCLHYVILNYLSRPIMHFSFQDIILPKTA